MVMPTSNYWNVIYGNEPGEATKDEEGMQIMSILGKNMSWLMKLVDMGKNHIKESLGEDKIFMNFIR